MVRKLKILFMRHFFKRAYYSNDSREAFSPQDYWTRHNVTLHKTFKSRYDSMKAFLERSNQYHGYLELMPVDNASGKIVLDYGCGPGHDLVGFSEMSKPKKIYGLDVSETSLREADQRLKLHDGNFELIKINETDEKLPFEDQSIDIIHCSGVLHHTDNPDRILREFARILKDDGYAQIMVYNYNSIWMHLYTAYIMMIKNGLFKGLTKRQAFARLTDGPKCPIANCYKPSEFIELAEKCRFECKYFGAAISTTEMKALKQLKRARLSKVLDLESRHFLNQISFTEERYPVVEGNIAGVDGCYRLSKSKE